MNVRLRDMEHRRYFCPPGEERWCVFIDEHTKFVLYDYRTPEGVAFGVHAKDYADAIEARDEWLASDEPSRHRNGSYYSCPQMEPSDGEDATTHEVCSECARKSREAFKDWYR